MMKFTYEAFSFNIHSCFDFEIGFAFHQLITNMRITRILYQFLAHLIWFIVKMYCQKCYKIVENYNDLSMYLFTSFIPCYNTRLSLIFVVDKSQSNRQIIIGHNHFYMHTVMVLGFEGTRYNTTDNRCKVERFDSNVSLRRFFEVQSVLFYRSFKVNKIRF